MIQPWNEPQNSQLLIVTYVSYLGERNIMATVCYFTKRLPAGYNTFLHLVDNFYTNLRKYSKFYVRILCSKFWSNWAIILDNFHQMKIKIEMGKNKILLKSTQKDAFKLIFYSSVSLTNPLCM